ncbi:anti-sigma factor [Aureisphaera sp.]
MMDKKEILESGLLERYLLGEVSETEHLQVEQYLKDPEIRLHFQHLEEDFEKMALENAIIPPPQVKEALLKRIEPAPKVEKEKNNLSSFNTYTGIAAAIALLFGIASFWMYSKLNSLESQLQLVRSQNEVLSEDLENLVENYDLMLDEYEVTSNPNTQKLIMVGNDKSPQAIAISYINHKDKTVYLNAEGLPKLPENKDYQLWADVEGEMIDMGVITQGKPLIAMNYIEHAESLNITIEPSGGSEHPTVEDLITNIYLTSTP